MPPISGKQKKRALQAKRERKRETGGGHLRAAAAADAAAEGGATVAPSREGPSGVPKELLSMSLGRSSTVNRWSTVFAKETADVVRTRRVMASRPLDVSQRLAPLRARARDNEDPVLAHPTGLLLSLGRVDRSTYVAAGARAAEEASFSAWLAAIYARYSRDELNQFEHNVEVWMQLWHTLASAHVVCIVADVRNPLWHLPISLYDQITVQLRKPLVVILNKIDLVPRSALDAWLEWLRARFPAATFVPFSSSCADLAAVPPTLAARRRALRAARTTFDAGHVGRRVACVRALLSAVGAAPDAIETVVRTIEGTLRVGSKREDALLSSDVWRHEQPVAAGAGEEEEGGAIEEEGDSSLESGTGRREAALSADEVESSEEEGEGEEKDEEEPDSDDKSSDEEDSESDASEEKGEEVPIVASAPPVVITVVAPRIAAAPTRLPLHTATAAAVRMSKAPQQQQLPRGRGAGRGAGTSSEEGDGIDRFAGRPRHYKRGDAGRKLAEMEAGFRGAAAAAVIVPQGDELESGDEGGGGKQHGGRGRGGGGKKGGGGSGRVAAGKGGRRGSENSGGGGGVTFAPPAAITPAAAVSSASEVVASSPTLVIGMIGHPNAGKSSVINALCCEKRVSVSRTAGHTKRSQTIPLAAGLVLLDCPGLAFPHALVPPPPSRPCNTASDGILASADAPAPSLRSYSHAHTLVTATAAASCAPTPGGVLMLSGTDAEERAMQECSGIVPLAQVREPYTAVRYLSEHLPLERLYGLTPPRDELEDAVEAAASVSGGVWSGGVQGGGVGGEAERGRGSGNSKGAALAAAAARYVWSPFSLCEALAVKRGYLIAKTGAPDAHAAGREILYDTQDGVLPLFWLPPS